MTSRLWRFCKLSSSERLNKYSGSSTNSGKVSNRLKYILSKLPLRCQETLAEGLSLQLCFNKSYNILASRMKLFKDTKRVIRKVYLCNKCPLTIFKRLFLTKTTSNLLSKDKLHKWSRKRPIGMDWLIPLATITQTLFWLEDLVLSQSCKCLQWVEIQIKWVTRWTDYNTCNMNASKQNWKRNMIKGLTFCTKELKRSNHIKVHIKMLISF